VRAPRSAPGRDREGAPLVAIVNQTTAHGFWGSEEAALGKHVVVNARRTTIVGVVGDIYQAGARGEVPPGIYQPDAQFPRPSTTLVVKAGPRAAALSMPRANTNGIALEYEVSGDPAAPPILLIMGLGMQLTSWPPALRDGLVARGFRVIAFDNRDAGLSTRIRVRRRPNLVLQIARAWARLPVRAP